MTTGRSSSNASGTGSLPDAGSVTVGRLDLNEAVRTLAMLDRRTPALLVEVPVGGYLVLATGYGGPSNAAYVISRHQLTDIMFASGIRRDHLADPAVAERLTTFVAEFHQRRKATAP
jgi:hypothetical protein